MHGGARARRRIAPACQLPSNIHPYKKDKEKVVPNPYQFVALKHRLHTCAPETGAAAPARGPRGEDDGGPPVTGGLADRSVSTPPPERVSRGPGAARAAVLSHRAGRFGFFVFPSPRTCTLVPSTTCDCAADRKRRRRGRPGGRAPGRAAVSVCPWSEREREFDWLEERSLVAPCRAVPDMATPSVCPRSGVPYVDWYVRTQ